MNVEEQLGSAYKRLAASASGPLDRAVIQRAVAARRRRRAVVASGTVGLAVVGTTVVVGTVTTASLPSDVAGPEPQAASSAHPGVTKSVDISREDHWQNFIQPYLRDLSAAAEAHDNFSGLELVYEQRAIVVYGTGEAPSDVASLFAQAPEGVAARWATVPYSVRVLTAAGDQLARVIPRVVAVQYVDHYSRIQLMIDGLPKDPAELRAFQDKARSVTDIPVTFVDGGATPAL